MSPYPDFPFVYGEAPPSTSASREFQVQASTAVLWSTVTVRLPQVSHSGELQGGGGVAGKGAGERGWETLKRGKN